MKDRASNAIHESHKGTFARIAQALTGLQLRFTLLVVALALAVGAIVGIVTIDFSAILVNRLHQDHCTQTAALLANKASAEYTQGDEALDRLAQQMVRTDPLLFVSFMDVDGVTRAIAYNHRTVPDQYLVSGATPGTPIGNPSLVAVENRGGPYLDVTYPVRASESGAAYQESQTTLLGYTRIGFSLERTFAEVNATTELLTGIAVLVVALTVPLGFLVVRRMVSPLRELAGNLSRFADGDESARSSIRRNDEIGELATAYNDMADKLAQKHREINQLNQELEQRVQDRTRQLRELAARDPLTGMYNRRHFSEAVQQTFAGAARYGHNLSCMMIDLDNFKNVNDNYGHQVGDELLCVTGVTITTELRSADVAARYGGDEFIILLPVTDTTQARQLGERIAKRLTEAVGQRYADCNVSMSIGIAGITDEGIDNADDLVRAADNALYKAKSSGKSTVITHEVVA